MAVLQEANKRDDEDTVSVVNSALRSLNREFEKDTLADATELKSDLEKSLLTTYGILEVEPGIRIINVHFKWVTAAESDPEID